MPAQAEQRFLIVRLGSLGDLVHTVPAAAALRSSFPRARIDWVVERKWSPLIELLSRIDNVIPWDRGFAGTVSGLRNLRRNDYTCAVDFQGLYKSAILARLAGAPQTIGVDFRFARESGASFFYTQRVIPTGKHVIERGLSLAIAAGAGRPRSLNFPFEQPKQEESSVRKILQEQGIKDFCVLSPGGGWRSKCWPAERYGLLCAELWEKGGLRAVVNCGPGEEALAQEVVAAAGRAKPFVYSPTLRELVALLRTTRLVVAADTGPMHLAASLGTPVVALFGPTDPDRNGPLPKGRVLRVEGQGKPASPRGDYARGKSFSPIMLALRVDQVLAAVEHELSLQS